MILVIDDLRTFTFDASYARTSAEGLAMLNQPWTQIWLDHDLGADDTGRVILPRSPANTADRIRIEPLNLERTGAGAIVGTH